MNRVPLILLFWISLWTFAGYLIGRSLETPGIYTTAGFVVAWVSVLLWPIIFPTRPGRRTIGFAQRRSGATSMNCLNMLFSSFAVTTRSLPLASHVFKAALTSALPSASCTSTPRTSATA
jgi:hypothetical protein